VGFRTIPFPATWRLCGPNNRRLSWLWLGESELRQHLSIMVSCPNPSQEKDSEVCECFHFHMSTESFHPCNVMTGCTIVLRVLRSVSVVRWSDIVIQNRGVMCIPHPSIQRGCDPIKRRSCLVQSIYSATMSFAQVLKKFSQPNLRSNSPGPRGGGSDDSDKPSQQQQTCGSMPSKPRLWRMKRPPTPCRSDSS